jgi:hypothetical protein
MKSVLCLLFVVVAVSAQHQRWHELDRARSASDEDEQFQHRLQNGVKRVEKCWNMQGDEIRQKVCDFDKVMSQSEKEMIKKALYDLQDKTSTSLNADDGIKLSVLLLKNVQDTKETDQTLYQKVRNHADKYQSDRAGFIVLGIDSDFSEPKRFYEQQQQRVDSRLNTPVFHNTQSGAWSNFYSTENMNQIVSPQEIVQIYSQKAPLLRQGTYGVAILDIIHEIREKAMQKLGKTEFQRSFGSNSEEVQKVERCLQQFETKVCDPDSLLSGGKKEQVDSILNELESQTTANNQQQLTGRWANCKNGGIRLMAIVIRDVQNHQAVDQKVNYMLLQQIQNNPCERIAVLMFSPSQDQRTGGQQFQMFNEGGQTIYYYRFPAGGWSKFYGIQNLNTPFAPVSFSEMAEIYDQQRSVIRQGDLAQVLQNILRSFKERVQQRQRNTREADFTNSEDNKQKTLQLVDECLSGDIKAKMCDPANMLENEGRNNVQKALERIQQETERSTEMDESKKKSLTVSVITIPFTEDISQHEDKISKQLSQWRQQNTQKQATVLLLSANKGDSNGRSKFYGASTRDALVNPHELVQFYNDNKLNIRAGKHAEALVKIVDSIHDLALRRQTGEKN